MLKIEIKERELRKALKKISLYDDKVQKGVKDRIALTALLIETEAKRIVPVKSGRLKTSINSDITPVGAIVGTNVEYAPLVEFGSNGRSAKAFLFPAFEKYRQSFIKSLTELLKLKK